MDAVDTKDIKWTPISNPQVIKFEVFYNFCGKVIKWRLLPDGEWKFDEC